MSDEPSTRPRCSVFVAASLDGYIARADGSVDWLSVVERPGEDYGYRRFFDTVDALVMGRNTYETVAERDPWPYAGTPCLVLTRRPAAPREGVRFLAATPETVVDRLAGEGARRVYVDGGNVIRQFLAARLIDDFTLSLIPVVLGGGIPLFGAAGPERPLALESVRSWSSGLCQLRYTLV